MKRKYINAILACSMVVSLAACTDVWDEHYQTDPTLNGSESLWELIDADPDLDDFAELLKATGYDTLLTKKRSYTVWAPVNLSDLIDMGSLSTASDSLLAVYRKEIVENHIADYSQVAGGIRDKEDKKNYKRVMVLNGKSYHFEGSVSRPYSFAGQQLRGSNIVANNGVLHKLDNGVLFAANIWEQMAKEPSISSLYQFLNSKTDTTFNESGSTPGSIIDGKQHYLDSAFIITNRWIDNSFLAKEWGIGRLNNEDSTYTMYALTNNAWDELYKKVRSYYNYPNVPVKKELTEEIKLKLGNDSLHVVADSLVREMLCENLVFSNTVNRMFFEGARDTLISTRFNRFKDKDAHALHDGCVKELELSNGTLHIIDQMNFKPYAWGYDTIRVEGESLSNNSTDRTLKQIENATVSNADISKDSPLYDKVSRTVRVFKSTNNTTTSSQPKLRFYVDGLLSADYRISIVIAPSYMVDPADTVFVKPNKFKAYLNYCQEDGTYTNHNFYNPNFEELKDSGLVKNNAQWVNNTEKLDTIVLAKRYKVKVCQYRYEEFVATPQTCLVIETDISFGTRGENKTGGNIKPRDPNNWKYDNYYRIDQVLFEPLEDIE